MPQHRHRVLHLVPWFGHGGRERLVVELILAMRPRWDGRVAIGGGEGIAELTDAGIAVSHAPLWPSSLLNVPRAVAAIRRIARDADVGIIHSHHRYAGMAGRIAASSLGLPFVSTVHDLAAGGRLASRFALGTHVTVFSDAVSQHVQTHFGVAANVIHRIPMGHASCAATPESSASVPTARGPVVGFVGRVEWEKGPDLFMAAAARVAREHPSAEFWVAGVGQSLDALKQQADDLGIAGAVRFLGWRGDIASVLHAMDIVVVPSRREGFGRTALEAMTDGKAVVATRAGGLGELITDGVTGCLVDIDDADAMAAAVGRLLQNPALARQIGDAARLRTAHGFEVAAMATAVEHVYELAGA